jgi:hypothetical protein
VITCRAAERDAFPGALCSVQPEWNVASPASSSAVASVVALPDHPGIMHVRVVGNAFVATAVLCEPLANASVPISNVVSTSGIHMVTVCGCPSPEELVLVPRV